MAEPEYVYTLSEPAAVDILEAAEYLEYEVPGLARRFMQAIQSTCRAVLLAPQAYPLIEFGRGTTAPAPGLRKRPVQAPFERYVVFYRFDDARGRVVVLRVLHGARNLPAILGR